MKWRSRSELVSLGSRSKGVEGKVEKKGIRGYVWIGYHRAESGECRYVLI